jgi:serine/threonine protein kinase
LKPDQWEQIFDLYHAALELPESERAAFLQTRIASDDVRREVASLLAHEGKGEALLKSPALEVVARMMAKENDSDSSKSSISMIGKTVSHYSIVDKIGQGGMGEVYQAKDLTLGRDVAIKVLPEEFARDADRVMRFHREAKLLASLNHPHIAAIHGLEESEGTNFLVLELVEGETIAGWLKRGPIPVEESLKIALQIAEALEAAHEKGVIHRDLKPANIKVTPEGKVKVLDFGLAKAFAMDQEQLKLSNSPTLSNTATQQGLILGTAAYMSPEQARGKSVDKRADIWAFGCVLYEMLTGRAAFQGEDVSEILAAVIRAEPEWSNLPVNLHGRLLEVLERCLKKDIRSRYHDISDVRVDVQKVLTDPSGAFAHPVRTAESRNRLQLVLPWVVAAVVLTAIVAGVVVWNLKSTPSLEPRHVMRFDYQLPEGQQFSPGSYLAFNPGSVFAVSPDGRQFAYATPKGLYLRSLDESASKLVAGTEGGTRQPFFSPDGKWIGYYSVGDSKLKKIAVNGGVPVELCYVPQFLGASWGEDNTIVYGQAPGGIMRISGNGGSSELVIKAKSEILEYPQVLPDGKSVLYTAQTNAQNTGSARIMVQGGKPGEPKELVAGFGARYLPTGHIVYSQGWYKIFAIPFNPARLEVTGGPVGMVDTVTAFAVSDAGTLVYTTQLSKDAGQSVLFQQTTLVWVDRDGKEEPIAAPRYIYISPNISADGTRVTVSAYAGPKCSIQVWDLARKIMTRLTSGEKDDMQSIWTPDGKRIIFSSSLTGTNTLCWMTANGTGGVEKLASVPGRMLRPWSISSDGKNLALVESWGTRAGISMMSMEGDHTLKLLLHDEKYDVIQPKISPDGKWVAYSSTESGHYEVYVRSFPDVERAKAQVSMSGGNSPLWSPNGRELFFLSNDNSVMAAAVQTVPTFKLETPKTLFKSTTVSVSRGNIGHPWDISPDGKRFLMIKPPAPTVATPQPPTPQPKINVVVNWLEELKQRVPVK